ncbi:MAG TPA: alpha/beta hydrolase [Albitalea sp.]
MKTAALCALALLAASASCAEFLSPLQVNALPATPAISIQYGPKAHQVGELRLPDAPGPHPVAVVIHGVCRHARHGTGAADRQNTAPLASALARAGYATWNIEYRSVDAEGGGWPGTFHDIANAVDHLRAIASAHRLELRRTVVVGHSAGGHLGTWLAARHRLPSGSELRTGRPLPVAGVVNLAGPADLADFAPRAERVCGQGHLERLLGGRQDAFPHRLREASPAALLPLGVPQVVLNGVHDPFVPPAHGQAYARAARRAGDPVCHLAVPDAAHFELIAPHRPAWNQVLAAVRAVTPRRLFPSAYRCT